MGGEGLGEMERFFHGRPLRTPPLPVPDDPLVHLGITGFTGGQVAKGRAEGRGETFRQAALAAAGAAGNEDDT